MKKITIILCFLLIVVSKSFSATSFEFGIGSGFVFYGDEKTKDLISLVDDTNQIILSGSGSFLFSVAPSVKFALGVDSLFDAHWHGGNYIYLWDYCGFLGVRVYPGFAGLICGVNYCLGRRTDFYNFKNAEEDVNSTKFGNGFSFSLGYDFGFERKGWAPLISAGWRRMPRGGSSDNIISVSVKVSSK